MFTHKKTVVTTSTDGSGLSESIDDLMKKGSEMWEKGMKVMDEAFKEAKGSEGVSTTIRIRLTPQHVVDLKAGKTLSFKTNSTTVRIEVRA